MIALVPWKGVRNGKSRLASVLSEAERNLLGRWMMERVLRSLMGAPSVRRVILVSRDVDAQKAAGMLGVESFAETSDTLNEALREAIGSVRTSVRAARAASDGPDALLIVPADVPLLTERNVEEMAALQDRRRPSVVAAPSRRGDGTNALLIRPPDVLAPSFGPDSFRRHQAQAERLGLRFAPYRAANLALDIDLPEDLESLYGELDPRGRDELSALLRPAEAVRFASGPLPHA